VSHRPVAMFAYDDAVAERYPTIRAWPVFPLHFRPSHIMANLARCPASPEGRDGVLTENQDSVLLLSAELVIAGADPVLSTHPA
jgi:hypothetical protein